jgi:hypothetical protein
MAKAGRTKTLIEFNVRDAPLRRPCGFLSLRQRLAVQLHQHCRSRHQRAVKKTLKRPSYRRRIAALVVTQQTLVNKRPNLRPVQDNPDTAKPLPLALLADVGPCGRQAHAAP